MTTIKTLLPLFEQLAPLAYAEDFDNVGLLVGNENQEVTGILICHDALEAVILEAIDKNCNLIICFHPILFSVIKKINGKNYVEKAIVKAIENKIAIYAFHTALDNHINGVNKIFCDALGLINTKILIPKQNYIQKLVTFSPTNNAKKVREALFNAGAGEIGNYSNCSFLLKGEGSFKGNQNSNPVIGQKNILSEIEETKIEVTFEKHLKNKIISALFESHEYEEVAYEIYELKNDHQNIGLGQIGELAEPMHEIDFLQMVKQKMHCGVIKHSQLLNKPIQKVAVLGGSGSFAIKNAILAKADVFLTADLKYHQFYEAENQIIIADIGHFESERYTKNYIHDFISKKIHTFVPNFLIENIKISNENTNPVKYL